MTLVVGCRFGLALTLAVAAIGKIADPGHGLLPRVLEVPLAAIELVCAGVLCVGSRFARLAALFTLVVSLAGIAAGYMTPRGCGCFGNLVPLTQRQHMMIASLAAVAAYWILVGGQGRIGPAASDQLIERGQ
jgi:hypothetical protein